VLRAQHRDVEIAGDVEALIGVVENQDLRPRVSRPLGGSRPIGARHYHGFGEETLVHQLLVPTVSPQQDAGADAAPREIRGDPRRDWRLAGSTHGQVADRDGGKGQPVHTPPAEPVGTGARDHHRPMRSRQREQQRPSRTGRRVPAPPQPLRRGSTVAHAG
jgi:hypothetical protein